MLFSVTFTLVWRWGLPAYVDLSEGLHANMASTNLPLAKILPSLTTLTIILNPWWSTQPVIWRSYMFYQWCEIVLLFLGSSSWWACHIHSRKIRGICQSLAWIVSTVLSSCWEACNINKVLLKCWNICLWFDRHRPPFLHQENTAKSPF